MKEFALIYFIGGLVTSLIAIYRYIRGKQAMAPGPMLAFSWFIFWWIWLPFLALRWLYYLIFKKTNI